MAEGTLARTTAQQVLWHGGDSRGLEPGSFIEKLLDAWAKADLENQARLRIAFPTLGYAVHLAQTEGLDAVAKWGGLDA